MSAATPAGFPCYVVREWGGPICTAEFGHDGDHAAHGPDGAVEATWGRAATDRTADELEAAAAVTPALTATSKPPLSGATYVAACLRENVGKTPIGDYFARIPVVPASRCDHAETICATWRCVESWAIDWRLYLGRTGGGRSLAEAVGWPADEDIPASPGQMVPDPRA